MSYRTGIIAAEDGRTINDTPLAYNSSYGHLKIDTRPEVKHIDKFDITMGGPTWNTNAGADFSAEHVFFEIEHHLPYIPRASVYMLVRDAPASFVSLLGKYVGGTLYAGAAWWEERAFMRVDSKKIQLIRSIRAYNTGFPATTRTSQLQSCRVQVKYMIFSNEAAGTPYETSLPFI